MGKGGRKAAIMFQGVASSSGKSVCATALCRILSRLGYNVAPFKAQNMSLNSYIGKYGGEMGRAQALQALAAYKDPDERMNPVLLKPMGCSLSQLIVLGEAQGIMSYRDYISRKPEIWVKVCEAYRQLSESADILIIEGAGSPAEINLQKHDIVNMRMAREAGAAVILVADIDRGGAFASLTGTMSLLPVQDRKYVKGFLLNRFRGDKNLLNPALEVIKERHKKPFFGIMPMIEDMRLPEEDSASFDLSLNTGLTYRTSNNRKDSGQLDVAVIKIPALSNFNDIDPLAVENCVNIRFVRKAEEFGEPDLVIIPGSRKAGDSLRWLRESGLAERILAYARMICEGKKGHILGICAGMQIMGLELRDPYGIEGGGIEEGLKLLPMSTELKKEKILGRVSGWILPEAWGSRQRVSGYEIHHGESYPHSPIISMIRAQDGRVLAYGRKLNNGKGPKIWGTYLHGIFEDNEFRHYFLKNLLKDVNMEDQPLQNYNIDRELDRVADIFLENVDIEEILRLVKL